MEIILVSEKFENEGQKHKSNNIKAILRFIFSKLCTRNHLKSTQSKNKLFHNLIRTAATGLMIYFCMAALIGWIR